MKLFVRSRQAFAVLAIFLGTTTTATTANAQDSSTVQLRTFIPSEAVGVDYPTDFINNGDNRGFSNALDASFKSSQSAILTFDSNDEPNPNLSTVLRSFGTSELYDEEDGFEIGPSWRWGLRDGAEPVDTAVADVFELSPPEISLQGNAFAVDIVTRGPNPLPPPLFEPATQEATEAFVNFTAPFNADFDVLLSRDATGTVNYTVSGSHDGFPAYELIIDDTIVYAYNPLISNRTPISLAGSLDIGVSSFSGAIPPTFGPPGIVTRPPEVVFGDVEGAFGSLIPRFFNVPDFEPDIPSFIEGVGTNELNFGNIPNPINSIAFDGSFQTEPGNPFVLGRLTYENGILSVDDLVTDLTISTDSPFRGDPLTPFFNDPVNFNDSSITQELVITEDSIFFSPPEDFQPNITVDIFTVPEGQTGVVEVLGQFVGEQINFIGLGQVLSGPGTGTVFESGFGGGGEQPTSVPESSSVVGIISFGVLGGGLLLKRRQRGSKIGD